MSRPSLFHTLPSEILNSISSHLDSQTDASFSLLSRQCASAAEPSVWRYIDLITADENKLCRRAKLLLKHGTLRRWEMVRSVRAAASGRSLHSLLQVLEHTEEHLWELALVPPKTGATQDHSVIDDLAIRLISCGPRLSFPNLTFLRLIKVTHVIPFIPYICSLAPRLEALDVEINNEDHYRGEDEESPLRVEVPKVSPADRNNGHLKIIRLVYNGEVYDYTAEIDVWEIFGDLLSNSPYVRHLSVLCDTSEDFESFDDDPTDYRDSFYVSLKKSNVRYLHWQTGWGDLPRTRSSRLAKNLRKLLIGFDWSAEADDLPIFPALETIIFDCSSLGFGIRPAIPYPTPLQYATGIPLDSEMAAWFRANPALHFVDFDRDMPDRDNLAVFYNLDDLERANYATATITSMRHDESEILLLRLLLQELSVPSYDVPNRGEAEGKRIEIKRTLYMTSTQAEDAEYGVIRSKPIVEYQSDWDGAPVPLEVLGRMRGIEGLTEEEWDKRNVVVGDKAWAVLTSWRDGLCLNLYTAAEPR